MDAFELPQRPNLEQYKKQAKELLDACKSGDLKALHRLRKHHPGLAKLSDADALKMFAEHVQRAGFKRETFALTEAQFIIARYYGFESWPKFAEHIEAANVRGSPVSRFEKAADATVTGDIATLERLVRDNPALTRERSTRAHHATLLHYVSANGVEDFRQKTPANAVAVARLLLEAGAEVDAIADCYGSDRYQTTMNLLVSSVHPWEAGLQSPLAETLLDFGAAINGLDDDGSPIMTALAFQYADAAETLARRGARVDNILIAAGLGLEDLVRSFLSADGILKAGARMPTVRWLRYGDDPKVHLSVALIWAARLGRAGVVEVLSHAPVDLSRLDGGMTALHWAAARGFMDIIRILLDRGAQLEAKNEWGGTVLDSTLWFADNDPWDGADYGAVIRMLIEAGARVDVYPEMQANIEAVLRR